MKYSHMSKFIISALETNAAVQKKKIVELNMFNKFFILTFLLSSGNKLSFDLISKKIHF